MKWSPHGCMHSGKNAPPCPKYFFVRFLKNASFPKYMSKSASVPSTSPAANIG